METDGVGRQRRQEKDRHGDGSWETENKLKDKTVSVQEMRRRVEKE